MAEKVEKQKMEKAQAEKEKPQASESPQKMEKAPAEKEKSQASESPQKMEEARQEMEVLEEKLPTRTASPFEEMERWMEDFLPRRWMPWRSWPSMSELSRLMDRFAPRIDLIDRDEEIVLRAGIPGVAKDDLNISVTDNAVTFSGTTKREEKEEKGNYHRSEIEHGEFARTVGLPAMIDTEQAKATFQDGILEVTLPKLSKAKRRQITVE